MLITRKIGKILRGDATPPQLMLAAVIGTVAGFIPGFIQAPGLWLLVFALVLLLNVQFAVVGVTILLMSFLSIFLLPVSFAIGRVLLEGPLQGLFGFFVNAPGTAFFGLEYYAVTGGVALGLVLGILWGWCVIRIIDRFRRKMAHLEKNSEKFKQFTSKGWVKLILIVFAGGTQKKHYEDLLARRKTKYLRPLGLVAVLLLGVLTFVISLFTGDTIVQYVVRSGLEKANGATVDVERAELSLREGRLSITRLAMADPNALDTDILRAAEVEADISNADLLRKRFHIERLRLVDASTGEKRRLPGRIERRIPERPRKEKEPGDMTLEDYLEQARVWRERLGQARDWFEKISRSEEKEELERPETRSQRIAREIQEKGYAGVRAEHLIQGSPTVLISYLAAEAMRVAQMPEETLDIIGENLSTHPRLVEKPPVIRVASSADTLFLHLDAGEASRAGGENLLEFHYLNLPVETVAGNLRVQGEAPLQGGTIDVRSSGGGWTLDALDLPLEITVRETRLAIAGVGETPVDRLVFPIGVRGPMDDPRIEFDQSDFADALADAGKAELAGRLKGETDRLRDSALERLRGESETESESPLEGIRDVGRGILRRN